MSKSGPSDSQDSRGGARALVAAKEWKRFAVRNPQGYYDLQTDDTGEVPVRLFLTPQLLADAEVTAALSPAEIEEKFDLGYHTKHVDTIFKRVFS